MVKSEIDMNIENRNTIYSVVTKRMMSKFDSFLQDVAIAIIQNEPMSSEVIWHEIATSADGITIFGRLIPKSGAMINGIEINENNRNENTQLVFFSIPAAIFEYSSTAEELFIRLRAHVNEMIANVTGHRAQSVDNILDGFENLDASSRNKILILSSLNLNTYKH